MDLKIDLKNVCIESDIESLKNRPQLSIDYDTDELEYYYKRREAMINHTIFQFVLGTGADEDPFIHASVSINDLEEFAHGILRKIKMAKRDYPKEIKYQYERHCCI